MSEPALPQAIYAVKAIEDRCTYGTCDQEALYVYPQMTLRGVLVHWLCEDHARQLQPLVDIDPSTQIFKINRTCRHHGWTEPAGPQCGGYATHIAIAAFRNQSGPLLSIVSECERHAAATIPSP